MKKRAISLFFVALLIMLYSLIYRFYFWNDANYRALGVFTEVFHQLFLTICLLIFLGVLWFGSSKPARTNTQPPKLIGAWWIGFSLIALVVFGLALYVNPHAHFSSVRYPSITPNARLVKVELYKQMETAPDVVVLGSSRAFTIAPQYLNENLHVNAFNMSVEGGLVGDFFIQLNYMLSSDKAPQALIVEISRESFNKDFLNADLQPLSLITYMKPDMAASVIYEAFQDSLSLNSFSDSAFLLTLPDVQNRERPWSFEKDGWGIRKPFTHEQYLNSLEKMTGDFLSVESCVDINPSAKKMFEATLAEAEKNNIGVVLYESPMHVDLYNALYENDPGGFEFCSNLYRNYFNSLAESHPNVFFRDLSNYELVNDLGESGFHDGIHLKPNAAEMVVDALTPEIESALTWSRRQALETFP